MKKKIKALSLTNLINNQKLWDTLFNAEVPFLEAAKIRLSYNNLEKELSQLKQDHQNITQLHREKEDKMRLDKVENIEIVKLNQDYQKAIVEYNSVTEFDITQLNISMLHDKKLSAVELDLLFKTIFNEDDLKEE